MLQQNFDSFLEKQPQEEVRGKTQRQEMERGLCNAYPMHSKAILGQRELNWLKYVQESRGSFQPLEKHLKSWKPALSLKWFHKSFMPFFITASIMCWAKDLIILFLCHFEVIMSYFAPVHVTGRSHHHCILPFYRSKPPTHNLPSESDSSLRHYWFGERSRRFCGRALSESRRENGAKIQNVWIQIN